MNFNGVSNTPPTGDNIWLHRATATHHGVSAPFEYLIQTSCAGSTCTDEEVSVIHRSYSTSLVLEFEIQIPKSFTIEKVSLDPVNPDPQTGLAPAGAEFTAPFTGNNHWNLETETSDCFNVVKGRFTIKRTPKFWDLITHTSLGYESEDQTTFFWRTWALVSATDSAGAAYTTRLPLDLSR